MSELLKLMSASVDWHERYANSPVLELNVLKEDYDRSSEEPFIFRKKVTSPSSTLYYAEKPCGLVKFYCHNKLDARGYGGSEFTLKVFDDYFSMGSMAYHEETIKGPWSSRAGAMNTSIPDVNCLDIHLNVYKTLGDEHPSRYASSCTLELALKALQHLPEADLVEIQEPKGDRHYEPKHFNSPPKGWERARIGIRYRRVYPSVRDWIYST